jgi:DNA-binding transcriptional LysR family regulator
MIHPKVTLEQWRTLQAVVSLGGYAQAAEHLHRSQSSVSYAIRRLEEQLGLKVLAIQGRKAELTDIGKLVLERAQNLIREASELEQLAQQVQSGWESRLRLVVDAAFPTNVLMQTLQQFVPKSRGTQVELSEVILSGAYDLLASGQADIVIGHQPPAGYLGSEIMQIPFIAVAHHEHPLNNKGDDVTENDLRKHRQIIVRDSGQQQLDKGWLSSEHRWSVSSLDTSVTMVVNNMGYAWLPLHKIETLLKQGILRTIPLRHGRSYRATLFLYFSHKSFEGPAARILSSMLEDNSRHYQEHMARTL